MRYDDPEPELAKAFKFFSLQNLTNVAFISSSSKVPRRTWTHREVPGLLDRSVL